MAVYDLNKVDPSVRRHHDAPPPPAPSGALTVFHGQICERLAMLRGSVASARRLADRLSGPQPQAVEDGSKEYGPDCLLAAYGSMIEDFDRLLRELDYEQLRIAEAV